MSPDKAANRLYLGEAGRSCTGRRGKPRKTPDPETGQGSQVRAVDPVDGQETWDRGGVRAHSRAAPQVRVVYLVTQAQP